MDSRPNSSYEYNKTDAKSHSPRPIPSPQPSNLYSPPTDFDYINLLNPIIKVGVFVTSPNLIIKK